MAYRSDRRAGGGRGIRAPATGSWATTSSASTNRRTRRRCRRSRRDRTAGPLRCTGGRSVVDDAAPQRCRTARTARWGCRSRSDGPKAGVESRGRSSLLSMIVPASPGRPARRRLRSAIRDSVAVLWAVGLIWYVVTPGSTGTVADLPAIVLVGGALVGLIGARRVIVKLLAYARVLPRARRNRLDLMGRLARRPAIAAADISYEVAALVSSSVDARLKYLASAKVSSRIGCPF